MLWSWKIKVENVEKFKISLLNNKANGKCYRLKMKDWRVLIELEPDNLRI